MKKDNQKMIPVYSIINCESGTFLLLNRNDFISKSIFTNGTFEPISSLLVQRLFDNDAIVLDVGCNIGTFSVPTAKYLTNGKVFSFEAQRVVFYQHCANIILNQLDNVFAQNLAVGNSRATHKIDVPVLDYLSNENVGATSLLPSLQSLQNSSIQKKENVTLVSLDTLFSNERIDFIKIDVEGMEYDVLEGAKNVIAKCNPVIFFECWDEVLSMNHILNPKSWFLDKQYDLFQIGQDVLAFPKIGIRSKRRVRVNQNGIEIIADL